MKQIMVISVIFPLLCLSLLLFPHSGVAAEVVVIPLLGQSTKIESADVVKADTTFGSSIAVHKFERRLSDGTYLVDWQVPTGKKLVITLLSVSPYDLNGTQKCSFQFAGYTPSPSSEIMYIQDFLVTSGQTYNFSFGAGVIVGSNNHVAIIPKNEATGGGKAYLYGYLID